jgi:hypothetical protein
LFASGSFSLLVPFGSAVFYTSCFCFFRAFSYAAIDFIPLEESGSGFAFYLSRLVTLVLFLLGFVSYA